MTIANPFASDQVSALIAGKTDADRRAQELFIKNHPDRQLIRLNQQHTANCLVLTSEGDLDRSYLNQPTDACLTDRRDVILTVRTADCLPILIHHPTGIIGVVHAGRKGTELGILQQTLLLLKATWNISEAPVQLYFGPAICGNCYQIDREHDLRYNLRVKNRRQCEAILGHNRMRIIDSEHCTFHNKEHWHSYRREGEGVAMNYSLITLTISNQTGLTREPALL